MVTLVLRYENDLGKVEMGGGGKYAWRITEIAGLALPPKNPNVITYAGQSGQETMSETSGARVITIAGDVRNDSQLRFQLTNAVRIFNLPGALKLHLHNKRRKIECRVNAFELGERNGAAQPFVLQLTADNPDFSDVENRTVAVFRRIDMVDNENLLPMELTRRVTGADIMVLGDTKTEPTFYLTGLSGGAEDDVIDIQNTTAGQSVKLQYSIQAGEVVTVDIAARKITSSINGNIISCITDDTFLNEFWFDVGLNHVEVVCRDENQGISVVCEFANKYIEAVY